MDLSGNKERPPGYVRPVAYLELTSLFTEVRQEYQKHHGPFPAGMTEMDCPETAPGGPALPRGNALLTATPTSRRICWRGTR